MGYEPGDGKAFGGRAEAVRVSARAEAADGVGAQAEPVLPVGGELGDPAAGEAGEELVFGEVGGKAGMNGEGRKGRKAQKETMRPITSDQWKKAPLRTKSWLLVHALNLGFNVYWHVTRDGTQAGNCSGSYPSWSEALRVLAYLRRRNPREYKSHQIRRDLTFYWCAQYTNPARTVIAEMIKRGFDVAVHYSNKDATCTMWNRDQKFTCWDSTPELAICAAALLALGLLREI